MAIDPRIQSGIAETAQALGMSPIDLATIISYETGGTFDPTQAGPTTQWGQHRGLIQFGEPQAKAFGVDWNDPIGSQLGANGAIVKYFRASGWKPGMSLLDAYSTVNAGAPGRYNASDANNGGAPGTVADKVNSQFGPHRERAAALFGTQAGPAGMPVPADMPGGGLMAQGVPAADTEQAMLTRIYDAFINGQMTPEHKKEYEKDALSGNVWTPPQSVFAAYLNAQKPRAQMVAANIQGVKT
jgi:hypothetical protein